MMKTKKSIFKQCVSLGILYILICNMSYSQEYTPFKSNCVWSVNTFKYMTYGDTIINNKTYLKVYRQMETSPFEFDVSKANYFCAIRNDTATKRVYGIYRDPVWVCYNGHNQLFKSTDTTEFLLYDFALKLGDTISVASFECVDRTLEIEINKITRVPSITIAVASNNNFYISDVDSIIHMNDSTERKRILIKGNNDMFLTSQFWIEGIGSSMGMLSTTDCYVWDMPHLHFLCYQEDSFLMYQTPVKEFDSNADCYDVSFGGSIAEKKLETAITIYPNPASNNLTLSTKNMALINHSIISICNLLGQEVRRVPLNQPQITIDLSTLYNGFYIIHTIKENKKINSQKIIKIN